jgi:nucleoside-diphosphate-sugar epimerase
MKILIVGNGFIGSSIIHRLESEGHEILCFSRRHNLEITSQQIVGDIFNFDEFIKTLNWKPQAIIHTAWVTAHNIYTDDTSNYKYAEFTSNLARVASQKSVEHLVILGTCAEYGYQTSVSTAGLTQLQPNSIYGEQKVVAFNLALNSLFETGVRLTWARIFQPYGLNQDKARLIPYLIDSIRSGRQVELRDTNSVFDWVTTRDIGSAISWILNHDTPTEVDIGTSVGYTNLQLLQKLEALLGNSRQWARITEQSKTGNSVTQVGNDSPLFISGWLPNDDLDSGLRWVLEK